MSKVKYVDVQGWLVLTAILLATTVLCGSFFLLSMDDDEKKPPASNQAEYQFDWEAAKKAFNASQKTKQSKSITPSTTVPDASLATAPDASSATEEEDTPGTLIDLSKKQILPIRFPRTRANPRLVDSQRMDALVEALRNSGGRIQLTGHTTVENTPTRNLYDLGRARARNVRDLLVEQGIAPERFVLRSMGALHPIAPQSIKKGRIANRRVTLRLLQ